MIYWLQMIEHVSIQWLIDVRHCTCKWERKKDIVFRYRTRVCCCCCCMDIPTLYVWCCWSYGCGGTTTSSSSSIVVNPVASIWSPTHVLHRTAWPFHKDSMIDTKWLMYWRVMTRASTPTPSITAAAAASTSGNYNNRHLVLTEVLLHN